MRASVLAIALLVSGCGGTEQPERDAAHQLASASVALSQVPAGVSCIAVEADGLSRSVTTSVDVAAGGATSFTIGGLPTGAVIFTAHAWSMPCGAVGSAQWLWFSERQTVQVGGGIQPVVSLTLYR